MGIVSAWVGLKVHSLVESGRDLVEVALPGQAFHFAWYDRKNP